MTADELKAEGAKAERLRIVEAINQIIASFAPISSLPNHPRNDAAKHVIPELEKFRDGLERHT